ncbi:MULTISPECIES: DUF2306 domain-containing protein [unclassified Sphingobacterium]|uniref:DUF2306 domain-containing protein n=1 Tax=unclassified Sphingobacterium TaxID=2609468 RepID=UPI0025F7E582|nr:MULTISPECIES: DUF2306 domain-containing protein [unclassified Sphingobacterium]
MAEITWRYRFFELDAAFLQIKQTEIQHVSWYKYIFYTHVCSAILVLPAGFTQFNSRFLLRYPRIHRIVGYLYVSIILLLAAPSGILIGLHANGGITAQVAFVLLGLLWFYFTLMAVLTIRKGNVHSHQKFMYRSFALTCSALTLRYWKVVIVYFFQPNPMDVYQIIAWLGWVPNLLIMEWFIYRKFNKL